MNQDIKELYMHYCRVTDGDKIAAALLSVAEQVNLLTYTVHDLSGIDVHGEPGSMYEVCKRLDQVIYKLGCDVKRE